MEYGLKHFLLFFVTAPTEKKMLTDPMLFNEPPLLFNHLSTLKNRFGEHATLVADVCLCPITLDGHCGIVHNDKVDNDKSLPFLSTQALWLAQAGADFVAPSDMMDGRVSAIRQILDENDFEQTGILSYTAKYASSYYWPFRHALDSAPKGTLSHRKTYQMDFHNQKEALKELALDEKEGADIVMVKPALCYLDIIMLYASHTTLPVAAYSVSGEYEWVKQMARLGVVEERELLIENLTAINRAGASIIITYAASEIARKRWIY